jgi:serine/threonine-protein kinase RsbW
VSLTKYKSGFFCCYIPSLLKEVDSVGYAIRKFLSDIGLAAASFQVELSVRECLNNAIVHGNKNDSSKKVMLELRVGKKWILLRVSDEGPGFNWREWRESPGIGSAASYGRGLSIISFYASRISFNRRGNQISLSLNKEIKGEQ